jgi:uncharacterized protein (DUF305 family)
MRRSRPRVITTVLLAAMGGACGATRGPDPAAAPAAVRTGAAAPSVATAAAARGHPADVRFMQRMMAHHAQALAMTALVPTRSARDDLRRLAERIEVSQRDEIAIMRQWLESRGQPAPAADTADASHDAAQHAAVGHAAGMPGMLTPDEMARLTAARGAEFDALFLRLMIRHHEGALAMVAELLGSQGAGQDAAAFQFASDVDADQRAEIQRMRALLQTMPAGTPRR